MPDSHEAKIKRLVNNKLATLQTQPQSKSKLYVILKACGWKKRSPQNLSRIQAAFEGTGIYPEPMLTAARLAWNELIYLTRVKPDPYCPEWYAPSQTFTSEQALKSFLVENFKKIPEFFDLKDPELEFRLPSGKRVDILCRECQTDAYVAIELKKSDSNPVGQLEIYLVEIKKKLAGTGPKKLGVKGMLITGRPNAALERSLPDLISDFPVTWFLFRVEMKLHKRSETRGGVVPG